MSTRLRKTLETYRWSVDLEAPGNLDTLRRGLPAAWIEEALSATGTVTLRRRRLPAEQVVWLVLGIALFKERSIADVVGRAARASRA